MPNLYGYAGFRYSKNGHAHQSVVQLLSTTNPLTDLSHIVVSIETLAAAVSVGMQEDTLITDYVVFSKEHVLLATGPLGSSYAGSGAIDGNHPGLESFTVTMTGKGPPLSDTVAGGSCLLRWVCGGFFGPQVGAKYLLVEDHGSLGGVEVTLAADGYIWGDYYGSKAQVRGKAPIQYNAALQRSIGS